MILLVLFQEVKLVPDGTLFVHIAIILVMIWVLNRTLYRPINRILAEREARTGGTSHEANKILRTVDEKLTGYEKGLRDARGEGYKKLEQARAAAMEARQAELNAVKEEVGAMVAEEKAAIEGQATEARASLLVEAKSTAASISGKILRG
jgi:F-type H+-transporting ATPase subunit b